MNIVALSRTRLRSDVMMKLYEDIFSELNSDSSFALPDRIENINGSATDLDMGSKNDSTGESNSEEKAGCFMCIDDHRRILGSLIVERVSKILIMYL